MENKSLAGKKEVGAILLLSLFFIIFLWGIWSKGIVALGINYSVFLALVTWLFISKLRKNKKYSKSDLGWIVPLFLIIISFSIYENPFFKIFGLLLFPALGSVFYAFAWFDKKDEVDWDGVFISKMIKHILSAVLFIKTSAEALFKAVYPREKSEIGMGKRILIGFGLLLFSLLIIIPVLSSADPVFGAKLKPLYDAITEILSTSIVAKIFVFLALSVGLLSAYIGWGRPETVSEIQKKQNLDIVITGIVLGGIFLVYIFFLWIQIDRLWVGALPFDFKETESLVKSGFWQLLFLSLVNLSIFFFLYRKTAPLGQKMLGIFSIASILLLVSSAHRMWLYVTYYGFSYEKFYASYAVLFCVILFIWLISRLFTGRKSNVVKFLAFQFLWMFALVSVFPVELFILKSNMALAEKPDTKIKLYEMTMLSTDVLPQIKKYKEEGKLKEEVENTIFGPSGELTQVKNEYDWNPWIEKREKILNDKKWYESNLNSIIQ